MMEPAEKQSNHFSFKWLLKKSKEGKPLSKSLHHNLADHLHHTKPVRVSKSCDTNLTVCSSKKYTSAFMFGRLLNSRSKSPSPCNKANLPQQSPFKTSFSSGDVCGLSPPSSSENQATRKEVSKSTQNIIAPEASSQRKVAAFSGPDRIPVWQMKNSSSMYATAASVKAKVRQESNQSYHLVLCRLCLVMMPSSEMYQLHECGCIFCIMCVQQYLSINIREGNVTLTCPDAECGLEGKIEMTEIKKLVSSDMYEMFQRFKLNRDVELDPSRTWCPRVDCETICFVRKSESSQGVAVHCPNCSLTFCSSCKERWHATKTCEDIRKERREEEDFLSSDDDESFIKRCPKCRVPIERDEGCAQMMCKRCKHVFCWYCLASLDDDFLLRHYDKGPCKNKLGHSRASVAWHRTQVVGIFAGFGLLLLVATPLLVLAAPCLLCCRCKQCNLFEEEPAVRYETTH